MSIESFLAGRLLFRGQADFSRPVVRLAVVSVALGLAVMIVSVCIVTGFQSQIREKVIGFGAHIQVNAYDNNASSELQPIRKMPEFVAGLKKNSGIRNVQVFATKAGIIKTSDQIQGAILKGIGSDYDWSFFRGKIIRGSIFKVEDSLTTDKIIISKETADRLQLKVNEPLRMYFIMEGESQPRGRKFIISGIYETGLGELDKMYVIGDIKHIQKLNNWNPDQVSGYEILINDFNDLDKMGKLVYHFVGSDLNAQTIKELYPQIFDWLDLQDINVLIILILMLVVSCMTMVSTLLILILEKTGMIGILKALGTKNINIRRLFLLHASYILGKGLLWGNMVGIGLCLLQLKTGLLRLPQESYYVSVVPINIHILPILALNIGTLLVCSLILILPSYIIARITPVRAIRFSM